MLITPIFRVVCFGCFPYRFFIAAVIFIIGSVTDFLDGG